MGGAPADHRTRAGRPRDPRLDAAIVAATIELLEERGYHAMSLAAVAERAETTTAAIYRRWGSKSELVTQAVFRTEGDDVVADTGELVADVTTMVRWSVDKICRPAALAALAGLLGERRSDPALSPSAALAAHQVEERLERAKATDELRADVDTRVLTSIIVGPALYAAIAGMAGAVDDHWIAQHVSVVVAGALPASRPRTRRATAGPAPRPAPRPAARPHPRPDSSEVTRR
jgi:AcrR family transcriptional regulator